MSNGEQRAVEAQEEWRHVLDWPEYEISTKGRVRRDGRLLALFPVRGYLAFNVSDGLKRKSLRVHRELARAFLGDNPQLVARHLDGDTAHCGIDNIAWGTFKDNEADKERHGRSMVGERHHQHKLSDAEAREIRRSEEDGKALARRFNVHPRTIWGIRTNRLRKKCN